LLSSAVLSSLSGARESSKIAAAESELDNIYRNLQRMITDTGVLPGGCIIPDNDENEPNVQLYLNDTQSGLLQKPSPGTTTGNYGSTDCEWSSREVNAWNGPYVKNEGLLIDPWGNPYIIDTQEFVYPTPPDPDSCPESELNDDYTGRGPKIYSQAVWTQSNNQGKTEDSNPTSYDTDCDDIWVEIGPMNKSFLD